MADAATRWAAELEAWAVPAHILEAAPQTPWVFPPDMFSAPEPGSVPRSGSTAIAAAAIPDGGTVLDVGCGGAASDRCTGTGEKSHQGAQVNVGHPAFTARVSSNASASLRGPTQSIPWSACLSVAA